MSATCYSYAAASYEGARGARVEAVIAGQLQRGSLCSAGLLPAQGLQAEYAGAFWAIHGCQLVPRGFAQHAQHHAAAAVCCILLQSVQQLSCPAIAQACVSTRRQLRWEAGLTMHAQHHAAAAVGSVLLQPLQQLTRPAVPKSCIKTVMLLVWGLPVVCHGIGSHIACQASSCMCCLETVTCRRFIVFCTFDFLQRDVCWALWVAFVRLEDEVSSHKLLCTVVTCEDRAPQLLKNADIYIWKVLRYAEMHSGTCIWSNGDLDAQWMLLKYSQVICIGEAQSL